MNEVTPILGFLNIGSSELVFIVFIVLILFGVKRMPDLANNLGKGLRTLKHSSDELKRYVNTEVGEVVEKAKKNMDEAKKNINDIKK